MKDKVIFLPVPESFKKQFTYTKNSFCIDPNIPIPVIVPEDSTETGITELSIDKIIVGMLRVIEEKQVKQKWIDYYCGFIFFLRPDILEICQDEQTKKNS